MAGGILVALILVAMVVGGAPQLLEQRPPVSYEIGLGLLITGGVVVALFAWFTLRREETFLPERIRILPDRVLAEYDPLRATQPTGRVLTFPFTDGTIFFEKAGFWTFPRVVNLARPTYPGEVRALVFAPANVAEVKRAWSAWKASPHESDLTPIEAPLRATSTLRTEEGPSQIRWYENSVASTGRHAQRLRQAAVVAGILVGAFFVLEVVILVPSEGLLWAVYWAVAWFPFDLMLLLPWLIVLLPLYPWWFKDIPQVGLDGTGVHLKHRNGKERVIPWVKVGGPTHQSFGDHWLLFFQLPDGTFSAKDFAVIDDRVARVIGQDPRCARQRMVKADMKALDLLTDPTGTALS